MNISHTHQHKKERGEEKERVSLCVGGIALPLTGLLQISTALEQKQSWNKQQKGHCSDPGSKQIK